MASEMIDQSFKTENHSDLILFTDNVLTCLPKHQFFKDNWADYMSGWETGRAVLESYKAAVHAAAEDHSPKSTADRDAKRAALLTLLDQWATYIALRASIANDPSLIEGTGFKRKVRSYAKAIKSGRLLAPTNVDVKHGPDPGTLVIRCDKMGKGYTYEVQATMGDPNDEAAWPAMGNHFPGSRNMRLKGLQSASRHHVRVRIHDVEGDMGPWSPHTPITVL